MRDTRRARRWARAAGAVLAAAALLSAAACSDDSSEPVDEADDTEAERSELVSPSGFDCALPASTIAEITGFDFTGIEPDGGVIGGTSGSLAWQGCQYETDGDATVELSIIVDSAGEPDVASYDVFAANATEGDTGGNDPVKVDGVGDSAVQFRDSLYFKSGDTAYAVSGEDDQGQPLDAEVLEELAVATIEAS